MYPFSVGVEATHAHHQGAHTAKGRKRELIHPKIREAMSMKKILHKAMLWNRVDGSATFTFSKKTTVRAESGGVERDA